MGRANRACGSSGKPGSTTARGDGSARYTAAVQFAKCVRSHGVPNFPDPSSASGGVTIPTVNQQSPAFQSARQTCAKALKAVGPSQSRIAQVRAQMLHFAQCMRNQGITGFPDPTLSPPANSNPADGNAVSFDGVYLPIPKHAGTVCHRSVADLHLGL